MHWDLSGACLGRSDITSCDVIDAIAKNPEVSRGSQKKKCRGKEQKTEQRGKYGSEKDKRMYGTRWLSFLDALR